MEWGLELSSSSSTGGPHWSGEIVGAAGLTQVHTSVPEPPWQPPDPYRLEKTW